MQLNTRLVARKAERRRTRIYSTIIYRDRQTSGRVVNLSALGMALEIDGPFDAANGSQVRIMNNDLGSLEGTIIWKRNGRIGVRLHQSSNAVAQISSYFRFFHNIPTPVLRQD